MTTKAARRVVRHYQRHGVVPRELLEACIPNEHGKGYHDDKTGYPCSPGGAASSTGAQARKKTRRMQPDGGVSAGAPRKGGIGSAIGKAARGAAGAVGRAAKGLAGSIGKAAGGTAGILGKLEHGAKMRAAKLLDKMGRAGTVFRGAMNVYFSTYRLAFNAVQDVASQLGKSDEDAAKVSGIFAGRDIIAAKPALIAGEVAHLSGQALVGMSFVPVASVAYLLWSARPKGLGGVGPLGVIKAAARAIKPTWDSIIHPDKYKATATHHESIQWWLKEDDMPKASTADPEQIKQVFDRLDQFEDEDQKEWYTALLHVAMDFTGQDVGKAMKLADDVMEKSGGAMPTK